MQHIFSDVIAKYFYNYKNNEGKVLFLENGSKKKTADQVRLVNIIIKLLQYWKKNIN